MLKSGRVLISNKDCETIQGSYFDQLDLGWFVLAYSPFVGILSLYFSVFKNQIHHACLDNDILEIVQNLSSNVSVVPGTNKVIKRVRLTCVEHTSHFDVNPDPDPGIHIWE